MGLCKFVLETRPGTWFKEKWEGSPSSELSAVCPGLGEGLLFTPPSALGALHG